ncbi:MAG TPA: hypothetical protein VFS43_46545 [Polyangiaceae bacterium]|nr:hypothetical protein [Polyangiaceae bacterium]
MKRLQRTFVTMAAVGFLVSAGAGCASMTEPEPDERLDLVAEPEVGEETPVGALEAGAGTPVGALETEAGAALGEPAPEALATTIIALNCNSAGSTSLTTDPRTYRVDARAGVSSYVLQFRTSSATGTVNGQRPGVGGDGAFAGANFTFPYNTTEVTIGISPGQGRLWKKNVAGEGVIGTSVRLLCSLGGRRPLRARRARSSAGRRTPAPAARSASWALAPHHPSTRDASRAKAGAAAEAPVPPAGAVRAPARACRACGGFRSAGAPPRRR